MTHPQCNPLGTGKSRMVFPQLWGSEKFKGLSSYSSPPISSLMLASVWSVLSTFQGNKCQSFWCRGPKETYKKDLCYCFPILFCCTFPRKELLFSVLAPTLSYLRILLMCSLCTEWPSSYHSVSLDPPILQGPHKRRKHSFLLCSNHMSSLPFFGSLFIYYSFYKLILRTDYLLRFVHFLKIWTGLKIFWKDNQCLAHHCTSVLKYFKREKEGMTEWISVCIANHPECRNRICSPAPRARMPKVLSFQTSLSNLFPPTSISSF